MRVAIALAFMLGGVGQLAAQTGTDTRTQPEACARLNGAQRQECVDRLSRARPPSRALRPADANGWVLSETTSPVDYTPMIAAAIWSQSASGTSRLKLSIRCWSGRTELELSGDGPDVVTASGTRDGLVVAYSVNREPPVEQPWDARGSVASFKGDVVRLLRSLPEDGELGVRVARGKSVLREGRFLLGGLSKVRDRLAAACKWPEAGAAPPDQVDDKRQIPKKGKAQ